MENRYSDLSSQEKIRNQLILDGVKAVQEFGFPDVHSKNILTDEVYKGVFAEWLDTVMSRQEVSTDTYDIMESLFDEAISGARIPTF